MAVLDLGLPYVDPTAIGVKTRRDTTEGYLIVSLVTVAKVAEK